MSAARRRRYCHTGPERFDLCRVPTPLAGEDELGKVTSDPDSPNRRAAVLIEWQVRARPGAPVVLRRLETATAEEAALRLRHLSVAPLNGELRVTAAGSAAVHMRHRDFVRAPLGARPLAMERSLWRQTEEWSLRRATFLSGVNGALSAGWATGVIERETWTILRDLVIAMTPKGWSERPKC